jgi:hypothetical protein
VVLCLEPGAERTCIYRLHPDGPIPLDLLCGEEVQAEDRLHASRHRQAVWMGPCRREACPHSHAVLPSATCGPSEDDVAVHRRGRLRLSLRRDLDQRGGGGPCPCCHTKCDVEFHGQKWSPTFQPDEVEWPSESSLFLSLFLSLSRISLSCAFAWAWECHSFVNIKAERKRKREGKEAAAATRLKSHHKRKREKKQARLSHARPREGITPSTNTEDLTSMASGGAENPSLVGVPPRTDDAEMSSSAPSPEGGCRHRVCCLGKVDGTSRRDVRGGRAVFHTYDVGGVRGLW